MANFVDIESATIVAELEFPAISDASIQQVQCVAGEIGGFRVRVLSVLGNDFQISEVYNCSTGSPVLIGTVSVIPGIDLMGGMFSSACMCDGDPLVAGTKFYKVNY